MGGKEDADHLCLHVAHRVDNGSDLQMPSPRASLTGHWKRWPGAAFTVPKAKVIRADRPRPAPKA